MACGCGCVPYLATAGSGAGTVATGAEIPLGALVTRECARMRLVGTGVVSRGSRRVELDAVVELTPATEAATPVELTVEAQADGQPVPGGRSGFSSTGRVAVPVTCTVEGDGCKATTLTLVNSGAPAVVGGVSVRARAVM